MFLLRAASAKALATAAAELARTAQSWDDDAFVLGARESACNRRQDGSHLAAVVAADPGELVRKLAELAFDIRMGAEPRAEGVFIGKAREQCRIAVLFSGEMPPRAQCNDLWTERFAESRWIEEEIASLGSAATQPQAEKIRAVAAEFAGWKLLERCNIRPSTAMGTGRGELLAFAAAGVVDEYDVMLLAAKMGSPSGLCMALQQRAFDDPAMPMVSSVTGDVVQDGGDAKELLVEQFAASAQPEQALAAIEADLLVDVSCSGKFVDAARAQGYHAVGVKPHSGSVKGLLLAVRAAFAAGAPVNAAAL